MILKEIITLSENIQLPNNEAPEFQPVIKKVKANTYYNLACTYSLLNQKKQAVENLEKSVGLGFNEYFHILADTDLDNIRTEKRFVALLNELSEKHICRFYNEWELMKNLILLGCRIFTTKRLKMPVCKM